MLTIFDTVSDHSFRAPEDRPSGALSLSVNLCVEPITLQIEGDGVAFLHLILEDDAGDEGCDVLLYDATKRTCLRDAG